MCFCGDIDNSIEVENLPEGFIASLELVQSIDWANIMKCPSCQQYWFLDEWDKYQIQLAIKVATKVAKWDSLDLEEERKKFLLVSRGGLSGDKCVWAGCSGKCVRDTVYCIDHLYATGARK